MTEQEMIVGLYEHFQKHCENIKIPLESLPIFDVQVAQMNEVIILDKQISRHEEMLSFSYEKLKEEKFMRGVKLGQKLDLAEVKKKIGELPNTKGRFILKFNFFIFKHFFRQIEGKESLKKND